MSIIIKFLLRNIKENKLRTLLILVAITLSVALFFASTAISGTVVDMFVNMVRGQFGESELMVRSREDAPGWYLHPEDMNEFEGFLEYAVGVELGSGQYRVDDRQREDINLQGYNLNELQQMNPLQIEAEKDLQPFSGRKVIISRQMAREYDLEPGDMLDLIILEERLKFVVAAIAAPEGLLAPGMQQGYTVVIPGGTMSSLRGVPGRVDFVFLKTASHVESTVVQEIINDTSRLFRADETISEAELEQQMTQITMPFYFMLIMVIVVSVFIIYTAFKVITMERLPVIGTFRSIGATRKKTSLLLLGESILYGLLGGILGIFLGLGILKAMTFVFAMMFGQNPYGHDLSLSTEISFSSWQIVAALAAGIILAVISSLIPIRRAGKISVKDIILDTVKQEQKRPVWKTVLGVIFTIMAVVVPIVFSGDLAGYISIIFMLLFPVGVILLIPPITNIFTFILRRGYGLLFGNEGRLALQNIKRNKSAYNSIALLAVGIASILLISVISFSVGELLTREYGNVKYDIIFNHHQIDRDLESRVLAVPGVESTEGIYEVFDSIKLADSEEELWVGMGIDANQYYQIVDSQLLGDEEEIISQFNEGRNVILTRTLQERWGVEEGQLLTFDTERGDRSYRVLGFTTTMMYNGDLALFPDDYLKQDMKLENYSELLVTTSEPPGVVATELEERFSREDAFITTMEEMERQNREQNNFLLYMLSGFSILTMFIGIFGILNNFTINFMVRRRTLALYRSLGMDGWQLAKMNLLEALSCGLIGGIMAVLTSLVFLHITGEVMRLIRLPIDFIYDPRLFLNGIIAAIIVSMVSVLSPSLRAVDLDLIAELKYE